MPEILQVALAVAAYIGILVLAIGAGHVLKRGEDMEAGHDD